MQTRTKLVILELIAGIVGWIWILGWIASIYFLIAVFAFDGKWSNFFWAVGISVIAKWLAHGFNYHKDRIAYEAKLVTSGVSPGQVRTE